MRGLTTKAAVAALVLALTGRGADPGTDTAGSDDPTKMDMSAMNEPDAPPADQVKGDRASGTFTVLSTAPHRPTATASGARPGWPRTPTKPRSRSG